MVFSNLRDRVENRIETINADVTIDADRKIELSGSARTGEHPLKFDIKAARRRRRSSGRTSRPRFKIDAPGLLQAPLSAKAEVRLNGSVVMINGLTGTLGDGAFNGWASVDLASKPLVKLDLDFQRLDGRDVARRRRVPPRSPGAMRRSTSTASTMSTRRRGFPQPSSTSATARFAPAAIDATLASGVLKAQISNLGAYDGNANGDLTDRRLDRQSDLLRCGPTSPACARCRCCRASPISTSSTARCRRRSACAPPATASARSCPNMAGTALRRVPGRRDQGPQRRADDPLADRRARCRAGRRARNRRRI